VTAPLDAVIVVPRRDFGVERVPELATAAAGLAGADQPVHLARYPSFGRRLRSVNVEAQSIPAFAREVIRYTDRTLIPSAVDRELRLAILRTLDWESMAPHSIAAAAAADREALHEVGSRLLGMAAWQDLDLSAAGTPINCFGSLQVRHEQILNALGWTPPERVVPHARQALTEDPDRLDLILGLTTDGIVIWECEELIEMGLEFIETISRTQPIVGIYVEGAAMRRPYAESHSLLRALDARGVECIYYHDLDLSSRVRYSADANVPDSCQSSRLESEGDTT
jgi:hypothetical protein